MPRTKEDHRAARALISAPYPLASITARSPPPPEPPVAPPGRIQGQDNEPGDTLHEAPAATYHGFQVFNPLWRDVEPAFPPVPYPPNDREKRRKWAVRLKKPVKAGLIDTGASEVELMSGIEEGVSREEVQAQQGLMSQHGGMDGVGSWDASALGFPNDSVISQAMQTTLPAMFLSPVSAPLSDHQSSSRSAGHSTPLTRAQQTTSTPTTPTQSTINLAAALPTTPTQATVILAAALPTPSQSISPLRTAITNRGRPTGYDASSPPSSDGEMTDSEGDADSEVTVKKVAGSSHLATPASIKSKPAHRPKPLFLGATNLTPFTFRSPSHRSRQEVVESSASEAGVDSDAKSIRTVVRIPRGRGRRDRHKSTSIARTAVNPTHAKHTSAGAPPLDVALERQLGDKREEGNATPTTATPQRATKGFNNLLTPKADPVTLPTTDKEQTMPQGASTWATLDRGTVQHINAVAPIFHPESVSYLPAQGDMVNHINTAYYEPPYSPTPMSIDPRSAQGSIASWPRPLSAREGSLPRMPEAATVGQSWMQCPSPAWSWPYTPGPPMHWQPPAPMGMYDPTLGGYASYPPCPPVQQAYSQPAPMMQPFGNHPTPMREFRRTTISTRNTAPMRRGAERSVQLPFAKICHNYLLVRKKQQHKRRKLEMNHKRKVVEKELRQFDGLGLDIITPAEHNADVPMALGGGDVTAVQGSGAIAGFEVGLRSVHSIARVDESRPPRKRRREVSPDSIMSDHDNPSLPTHLDRREWGTSTGYSRNIPGPSNPPYASLLPPAPIFQSPPSRSFAQSACVSISPHLSDNGGYEHNNVYISPGSTSVSNSTHTGFTGEGSFVNILQAAEEAGTDTAEDERGRRRMAWVERQRVLIRGDGEGDGRNV